MTMKSLQVLNPDEDGISELTWNVIGSCVPADTTVATRTRSGAYFLSALGPSGASDTAAAVLDKAHTGQGQFKLGLTNLLSDADSRYLFWCYCGTGSLTASEQCKDVSCKPGAAEWFASIETSPGSTSEFVELKPGGWQLFSAAKPGLEDKNWEKNASYPFQKIPLNLLIYEQGGIYDFVMSGNRSVIEKTVWTVVPPNTVSILLQVPQYVTITAGEILFSITGLEFSYSQSPPSMKACVQAVWLLTVAGGDLLDAIIAAADTIENPLLMYAVLMAAVMVVFMLMSIYWYTYTYYENVQDDNVEMETDEIQPPREGSNEEWESEF